MPYFQDSIPHATPIKGVSYTLRVWLSALIAVFAFLLLGSAVAADGGKTSGKPGAAQQARAACMSENVDRAACMREIGAARYEAKRGGLTEPESDFRQNALKRCENFTAQDDRQACERRVLGDGSVSGSVEEGGVLRQYTTIKTIQPDQQPPGSQPSMQPRASQIMPSGQTSPVSRPGMPQ
jgi:hypothetical protein